MCAVVVTVVVASVVLFHCAAHKLILKAEGDLAEGLVVVEARCAVFLLPLLLGLPAIVLLIEVSARAVAEGEAK